MAIPINKIFITLAVAGSISVATTTAHAWTTGFFCHPTSVADDVSWPGGPTTNAVTVTCSNKDVGENGVASALMYFLAYSSTDVAAGARASRLVSVIQAAILAGRTVRIDTDDNTPLYGNANYRQIWNFGLY